MRYLTSQHIHCVEAEQWNFKSQNILCAEMELVVTEYSACVISLVPWVKAILEVLLFTVPSWRWPLLGFCVF